MTIKFTENSYILGLWFSEDNEQNNTLTTAYKDEDNKKSKWYIKTRLRKKVDDYAFNSDDEKIWYNFESKKDHVQTDEELIKLLDGMQDHAKFLFPKMDKMIVQGNLEKFIKMCEEKPWMNTKSFKIIK